MATAKKKSATPSKAKAKTKAKTRTKSVAKKAVAKKPRRNTLVSSASKGEKRTMWSGSLSFGLLNIPIALQSAGEEASLGFEMLDKRNFAHIGYRQYNKVTGKEVTRDNIVKGYKISKGEYVVVTDEDFKKANPRAVSTIDIEDFVDLDDMDPMFFEKPYYLMPSKNGEKGYRLLRDVMMRTKKIAIGKVVLFRKQRLVAVLPRGEYLVLEVLRFARELLTVDEMPGLSSALEGTKVSAREVEMAEALVKGMTTKWDPEKYEDTYHDDLISLIEAKAKKGTVESEEIDEAKAEPEINTGGKVIDLMPLLKKSLEAGRASRSA